MGRIRTHIDEWFPSCPLFHGVQHDSARGVRVVGMGPAGVAARSAA